MNDERPIEKLLRRYAKKRRDETSPPPELHPATRQLLQGEVARQFPQARPARRAGFWALLQARWIYAAACVAVVGVGAVLLLPSLRDEKGASPLAGQEAEMSLAKATTSSDEKLQDEALKKLPADKMEVAVNTPAPVMAPAASQDVVTLAAAPRAEPAPQLSFDDRATRRFAETPAAERTSNSQPADQFKSAREVRAVAPTQAEADRLSKAQPEQPAPLAASALGEKKPAPTGVAGALSVPDAGKDFAVAESRPASPPVARAPSSAVANEVRSRKNSVARGGGLEREDRATVSQTFANLAPAAADEQKQKVAPPVPVLVNFRVEQTGDQLRVIDGDGSTYVGLAPSVAADAITTTDASKGAAAFSQSSRSQTGTNYRQAAEAQAAGRYLYRVEGTNRTLKQPVSFSWNFVAPTTPPGTPTQFVGGAVQGLPQAPWVDSVINGQVRINTGMQFELNAAPSKR